MLVCALTGDPAHTLGVAGQSSNQLSNLARALTFCSKNQLLVVFFFWFVNTCVIFIIISLGFLCSFSSFLNGKQVFSFSYE